jgi:DNA-binding MarR family transcriptional regulator
LATFNPDTVRAQREKLLLRLLIRSTEHMNLTMAERVRARGYEHFQASFTAVVAYIDTEGTRIGRIAERLGVSRQAASQKVREIEKHGYLERIADPQDARAVIVRHTPEGRSMLVAAIEVMLAIEAEYEAILGSKGLGKLKELLAQLAKATDPEGMLTVDPAPRR